MTISHHPIGAEISENKIKLYPTVITIDYIDLEKKTGVLRLKRGAKNPIPPPLVAPTIIPTDSKCIVLQVSYNTIMFTTAYDLSTVTCV
jgi:hypothetical protein